MRVASARKKTDFQVEFLENQLKRSLQPVHPDPKFVDHLHNRLRTPSTMVLERRQNTALGFLLVAFSLLSGVMLVLVYRHFRRTPVLEEEFNEPETVLAFSG